MAEEPPPTRVARNRSEPPRPPGWRVTPAPDGRGRTGDKTPRTTGPNGRWIAALVIVGLLALNLWISSQALKPNPRVRIPYSPTFLTQVRGGNVNEISSTGDSIQGSFRHSF